MKIIIIVTAEEYGTEIGELCPTIYSYQCFEKNTSISSQGNPIHIDVHNIPNTLAVDFLMRLSKYLNTHYRDFEPSKYESIIDIVSMMTIKGSSLYATNAVFGLFSTCTNQDTAKLIATHLSQTDIKHIAASNKKANCTALSDFNYRK